MTKTDDSPLYDRVLRHLFFDGELSPRSKINEKRLAERLGVSRVPIRETLGKISGQGLLVGEENGQGLRLRQYTPEEIRQLYEIRELLEGGAASAAARTATDLDIRRLQLICDRTETLASNRQGWKRWQQFDHSFHIALAEASHNERIIRLLKLLLTECHYVYNCLPLSNYIEFAAEDWNAHLQQLIEEYRVSLDLIRFGKADGAEQKVRAVVRQINHWLTAALLTADLRA